MLLEMKQAESMRDVLRLRRFLPGDENAGRVRFVELKGEHDEVWQTGEASEAVEVAIRELMPS